MLVVEAAALPEIRTTPYLAITQLLRAWLGIVGEDVTQASNRLRERLEAVAPQLATLSSAYYELLHIPVADETWLRRDPDDRRKFIQRAMRALFVRLFQARPVVMVFEDLHWLDDETLSMLDVIVESLGTARILLIVTYRLDHQERWKSKSYFARHRLYPFDAEQTSAFLDACLGTAPDLNSLRRQIAERAEGTPLFIEELVRHLTETAVLTGTYGQYRTTRDVDDIAIPQTVQNVIAARIDRLPPELEGCAARRICNRQRGDGAAVGRCGRGR